MINKYNILELLGNDKNKYHSCIITCYSFDFLFFEQRVLPRLRQSGIININLLVDEKMYHQQLNNLEGSYHKNTSYSITSVPLNGAAFHPKIIMAFGKTNGFVAIGSGNLTNSGLSSNDEVWGAFHTYKTESEAASLFKKVYEYVYALEKYCFGINKTKWDWILKNTAWLNEIINNPNTENKIETIEGSIALVSSFANHSIYATIIEALPKEGLESIVIISPYFNKRGQIISQFKNDLNPKTIKVVVDSRYGTVPYEYDATSDVQFYDWQKVESIQKNQSPRLHAKIIQFNYAEQSYILVGSANATVEALGTKNTHSKNAEMCLLISSTSSKDWLQEMELEFLEVGDFNLANYIPIENNQSNNETESFDFKIQHAELESTVLKINGVNFSHLTEAHLLKVVYRNETSTTIGLNASSDDEFISLNLKDTEISTAYKIYIVDKNEKKQSNSALVHYYQSIIKTNPDEKSLRFLELINQEELSDDKLMELLEYASFDRNTIEYNRTNNSQIQIKDKEKETEREYSVLDENQFNRNEEIIDTHSHHTSHHLTLLESFLDHIVIGVNAKENFEDSSEITAEEDKDRGDNSEKDNSVKREKLSYTKGLTLKNKINYTLSKIFDFMKDNHLLLLESIIDKRPLPQINTFEGIKNALIGIHLIFMKMEDSFEEEKIKFKIAFKNISELEKLEKESGFNIKRLKEQINASKNEIFYEADIKILSNIETILSKYNDISLIYIDETPSIIINHKYFTSNPIFTNKYIYFNTLKGFLINSISPLLLIVKNTKIDETNEDYIKYSSYRERLFYRVLVLLISNTWSKKEETIYQLFLLNLFETLMPIDTSLNEVKTKLNNIKNNLQFHIEVNKTAEKYFENELASYLVWKKQFSNNKTSLIRTLNKTDVQKIIYTSSIGFSKIITLYTNEIKVETPLGHYNDINENYEVVGLKIGSKGIMYY
jgi:hypothetical protein